MGFAGSGAASTAIAFAGLAGLLAGAFSMAAGEYISMRSQREAYEREITLEAMELRDDPEAEAEELALIYRANGLAPAEAERAAAAIMKDRSVALDTMRARNLASTPTRLAHRGRQRSQACSRSHSAPSSPCFPTFRLRPGRSDHHDRVGRPGPVRRGRGNRHAQRPRCPAVRGAPAADRRGRRPAGVRDRARHRPFRGVHPMTPQRVTPLRDTPSNAPARTSP